MHSIHKTSELSAHERHVVERLLGRLLKEDEAFRLTAPVGDVVKPAPTGLARQEASRGLREHIERMSARTQDVPDEELNAAIDQALAEARRARP